LPFVSTTPSLNRAFLVRAGPGADPAYAANRAPAPAAAAFPPILMPGTISFRIDLLRNRRMLLEDLTGRFRVRPDGFVGLEDLRAGLMGGRVNGGMTLREGEGGKAGAMGSFEIAGLKGESLGATLAPLVEALHAAAGLDAPAEPAIGDLDQTFVIREGRFRAENIRLPLATGELRATGWSALDGSLDYRGTWILDAAIASRLEGDSAARWRADAEGKISTGFRLTGTLLHPIVTLE
jgi:hypothetical protein